MCDCITVCHGIQKAVNPRESQILACPTVSCVDAGAHGKTIELSIPDDLLEALESHANIRGQSLEASIIELAQASVHRRTEA